MPVGELKRLMEVFSVSDAGCIERQHLTDALLDKFGQGRPVDTACLPCISQPSQCAICMSNFRDGDVLRQLGCSELHVFCTGCIQQWLDQNTSCPLCRKECGPPAPPVPPPRPPPRPPEIGGPLPSMMTPLGLMASLGGAEHTFLLLDSPFSVPNDAADPLAGLSFGGVGRALSRAFDARPPSHASPATSSPRQVAPPRTAAVPRERAPSRVSSGTIRLPPVPRPSLFTSSAASSDRGARAAPSSVRAAPPSPTVPSTSSNPPRRSSRLPSIMGALPRLPSLGRSSSSNVPPTSSSSSITGAGRSLFAAGSGRSFAAARRRRSSNGVAPDAVSL